jgi:hypothetical protein
LTNGHFITRLGDDLGQNAGGRRFDLDGGLVGFDLHERLALGNRLTFGFEPFEERARLLCHAERGHDDIGRQINPGSKFNVQGSKVRQFKF